MAIVSRQFRDNFEKWAQRKIDTCEFTLEEIEEWRGAIRKDLNPGPDQLRCGCEYITAKGLTMPATIDDHEERYRYWDAFFAAEITKPQLPAAGINQRICANIVAERRITV